MARNDILIYTDVVIPPPLNPMEGSWTTLAHPSHDNEGELHAPIYVRARMARGLRNLTTDHFSWLYDTTARVDGC